MSSQWALKLLFIRGLTGLLAWWAAPHTVCRRHYYSWSSSPHLPPTSPQSQSPLLTRLLNTSLSSMSLFHSAHSHPRSWASASPCDCVTASVDSLPSTLAHCASARMDLWMHQSDSLVEVPAMATSCPRIGLWLLGMAFKALQSPNPHLSSLIKAPVYLRPLLQHL